MSAAVGRPAGWQFGMVEKAVMRDETIPRNVKLLYAYLTIWCGEERSAFPGRARIARELGLSLSALDEAKKIGQDIGLWKVQNRPDPENPKLKATNKYWLNDQGGSYVPGSGTGARAKGKPRGRSAQRSPEQGVGQNLGEGVSQNLADPPPKSGQYQDQLSRPASIETNASSVDAPAGAHEQARGRANESSNRIHIDRPVAADEKELTRKLVAASTAAMKKAGKPLGSQGKKDLGAWVKEYAAQPVDALAAHLEDFLTAALAGDHPWLFEDLPNTPARPNTIEGLDELHDDYDGVPGSAAIDNLAAQGYHVQAIENILLNTVEVMA
jgi:hypothetical protein